MNEIFAMNDTSSSIMDFEVTASVSLLVSTTSQAMGNQMVWNIATHKGRLSIISPIAAKHVIFTCC